MPGQSKWAETGQPAPLAPHIYKPQRRSPKQRKMAPDEPMNPYKVSRLNRPVRYGKCKKERHNSRGCKASITGETPWQRRQRLEREKTVSNWDLNGKKKKKLVLNLQRYSCTKKWVLLQARGRVPAPSTRSGSIPQPAPQPPSQQPTQTYNLRYAT